MGRTPLALAAVAVLTTLAACDGSGGAGGGAGGGGSDASGGALAGQVEVREDAEARGPAPAVDGATDGGTITVHLPGDPGPASLDPAAGWPSTGSAIQQALTHRSLTQFRRDADGQPVLVPDLATDLGRSNDDHTEWTFTIREDATWENGATITAREVAWGITRSLDARTFPGGAGSEYARSFFAGSEQYAGPYTDPDATWEGVRVDGQDITITMSRPFPEMDHWASFVAMGPAPRGAASAPPAYGRKPLSSGPYRVKSFTPHEKLVLVRNDQWLAASDPARHQYADRWVFKFDQDQARVDRVMLAGGAAAEAAIATAVGSARYAQAEDELGDRLVRQPSTCVTTLTPDYTKITDIEVRRALAHAYPYQDVWYTLGEVPGVTLVPAQGILPPGVPGRRDVLVDGDQVEFDPEKAQELLAAAGYADERYPITMIYHRGDPIAEQVQDEVTRGFEESGFAVRAIGVDESPYRVWLDPEHPTNKRLNLRGMHWCADWPSGSTMIPPMLGTGAAYNTASFSEPAVDREIERIARLPLEDQADAWGALDETIMTDYFPIIPTAYRTDLFAFGARIGNPSGDRATGAPNYRDLYVSR